MRTQNRSHHHDNHGNHRRNNPEPRTTNCHRALVGSGANQNGQAQRRETGTGTLPVVPGLPSGREGGVWRGISQSGRTIW
ncbi:unnamed protein product [Gadus morhua 'NCC']